MLLELRRKDLPRPALTRRDFLRVAGMFAGAASALAVTLSGCQPTPHAGPGPGGGPDAGPDPDAAGFDLPSLGGAPDTPLGRTIAAFADTVMPGAHRDPTGAPGAIDAGAVALFFDATLPALQYLPTLAALLDLKAHDVAGAAFAQLGPADRDQVVEQLLSSIDLLDFAVELVRLAYYASPVGGEHLGYPGANAGYVNHPDFSFGVAMAPEITPAGNLP